MLLANNVHDKKRGFGAQTNSTTSTTNRTFEGKNVETMNASPDVPSILRYQFMIIPPQENA